MNKYEPSSTMPIDVTELIVAFGQGAVAETKEVAQV
jgi:hypothetical protein